MKEITKNQGKGKGGRDERRGLVPGPSHQGQGLCHVAFYSRDTRDTHI